MEEPQQEIQPGTYRYTIEYTAVYDELYDCVWIVIAC